MAAAVSVPADSAATDSALADSATAAVLEGVCDVDLEALDVELLAGLQPRL
ncbi:MAG: hypothetical protein OXG35_18945 [Acidobacteria bacterium]|nr:hypothetical protein [Acidobacteriota bacterium]